MKQCTVSSFTRKVTLLAEADQLNTVTNLIIAGQHILEKHEARLAEMRRKENVDETVKKVHEDYILAWKSAVESLRGKQEQLRPNSAVALIF